MQTGILQGLWVWRARRRLLRDARLLLKEKRRLVRRHGYRLKEAAADQVQKAAEALDEARASADIDALRDRLEKLDRVLEKQLGFARKSTAREYVESIGVAVLIALVLRAFVVEAFKIPSGSMIPTLKVGDHIFVNKFIYGVRIPLTQIKFFSRMPERGEVVVFVNPHDHGKDFIKRVVAVGGDTVEVRGGVIYVNGQAVSHHLLQVPCSYLDTVEGSDAAEVRPCVAYDEAMGQTQYHVIEDPEPMTADKPPQRIPPGEVFVMGDNRDNSSDSRVWGTVPSSYIKGKAMIVWWSSGRPEGVRWQRFFKRVHSKDPRPNLALDDPPR